MQENEEMNRISLLTICKSKKMQITLFCIRHLQCYYYHIIILSVTRDIASWRHAVDISVAIEINTVFN